MHPQRLNESKQEDICISKEAEKNQLRQCIDHEPEDWNFCKKDLEMIMSNFTLMYSQLSMAGIEQDRLEALLNKAGIVPLNEMNE